MTVHRQIDVVPTRVLDSLILYFCPGFILLTVKEDIQSFISAFCSSLHTSPFMFSLNHSIAQLNHFPDCCKSHDELDVQLEFSLWYEQRKLDS